MKTCRGAAMLLNERPIQSVSNNMYAALFNASRQQPLTAVNILLLVYTEQCKLMMHFNGTFIVILTSRKLQYTYSVHNVCRKCRKGFSCRISFIKFFTFSTIVKNTWGVKPVSFLLFCLCAIL